MKKLVLQEFVTLDGLAAGPNDSVDFVPASTRGDRGFGQDQLALMDTLDAILLGSVTYRMFAEHWPKVTEGEEETFADKLNSMGSGRPLFGRKVASIDMKLLNTKVQDLGAVSLTYVPRDAGPAGAGGGQAPAHR